MKRTRKVERRAERKKGEKETVVYSKREWKLWQEEMIAVPN